MTKEDIKKALECCSNPSISYCKDCPYANYGEFDCCNGKMCKDALNLITEQENEIEQLKAEVKQAKLDVLNELKEKKSIDKPHANIEALKASLSQSGPTYSPERLQADIRSLSSTMTIWDIDEMIKEIENDRV